MNKILIIDYGSQYNQLILRRIRELGVYSEIVPYDTYLNTLDSDVVGIILSGGPNSVYATNAPAMNQTIFDVQVPILGICYGMQILTQHLGGKVVASDKREYGKAEMTLLMKSPLTQQMSQTSTVWMSHADHVEQLPEGFKLVAKTPSSQAVIAHEEKNIYGVQFHPEVTHTTEGHQLIKNFVLTICKAQQSWTINRFIDDCVEDLRETIKDQQIIMGLSGGVDSSVAAALIYKAVGKQLTCLFIDTGLLRKNEHLEVMEGYHAMPDLKVVKIDARKKFLEALKGISDPESKRKIIGHTFVNVFEQAKQAYHQATFLAQGTIYPDVIESMSVHGPSATIKSHHNVGGMPENHGFEIVEPLRQLFKDEVRSVGRALGLPSSLIDRHPFPGPGLGIRIIGEVNEEKIALLQAADAIFIEALRESNLYHQSSQAFVTLLPVKTVGVMGDQRTYEYTCALRAVDTSDFMTANISHLPYPFLEMVSTRIINEVKGINRLVYDITSKPPGTIEWE